MMNPDYVTYENQPIKITLFRQILPANISAQHKINTFDMFQNYLSVPKKSHNYGVTCSGRNHGRHGTYGMDDAMEWGSGMILTTRCAEGREEHEGEQLGKGGEG